MQGHNLFNNFSSDETIFQIDKGIREKNHKICLEDFYSYTLCFIQIINKIFPGILVANFLPHPLNQGPTNISSYFFHYEDIIICLSEYI